jgi:alpha-glucosidase
MPPEWAALTVQAQQADPASTLAFYRHALALRRSTPALHTASFEWLDAPADCFGYDRSGVRVFVNAGATPVDLPSGEVLIASAELVGGQLPGNTAVWLR